MFIGIDHGTTAMRFSSGLPGKNAEFKISRQDARSFAISDLEKICPLEEIEGIAVCYSMGDNFSAITRIQNVTNRGLISREGAGEHIGGGTRVFDEVLASGIPAVVIPGIHRSSPTDPRFKVYSHQSSPEKIGILYEIAQDLGGNIIVSDVSSNTVTLLVSDGRIIGAFDACIFAPGTRHGALDVDAIRRIDWGECSANDAFQNAGVNCTLPEEERLPSLALFAAMECAALQLLNKNAKIALSGSCAPAISKEVSSLLSREVAVYDEWCAARGLAKICRDAFHGKNTILGLDVKL